VGLLERLRGNKTLLDELTSAAKYRDSLWFADLCWPPFDIDEPGVYFETATRMFVVEEHGGELRFYAGGAGAHVYDQPNELGIFPEIESVLPYAVAFLVRGLHPSQITTARSVHHANLDWGGL
jgi:hypothetical protein